MKNYTFGDRANFLRSVWNLIHECIFSHDNIKYVWEDIDTNTKAKSVLVSFSCLYSVREILRFLLIELFNSSDHPTCTCRVRENYRKLIAVFQIVLQARNVFRTIFVVSKSCGKKSLNFAHGRARCYKVVFIFTAVSRFLFRKTTRNVLVLFAVAWSSVFSNFFTEVFFFFRSFCDPNRP